MRIMPAMGSSPACSNRSRTNLASFGIPVLLSALRAGSRVGALPLRRPELGGFGCPGRNGTNQNTNACNRDLHTVCIDGPLTESDLILSSLAYSTSCRVSMRLLLHTHCARKTARRIPERVRSWPAHIGVSQCRDRGSGDADRRCSNDRQEIRRAELIDAHRIGITPR